VRSLARVAQDPQLKAYLMERMISKQPRTIPILRRDPLPPDVRSSALAAGNTLSSKET
jgi:hypothetical protein